MVTQEQIDTITFKYKEGKKREEIDQELLAEGWTEKDINETVSEVQRIALLQLPVLSPLMKRLENLHTKITHLPLSWAIASLGIVIVLLILVVFFLNFTLDPLGQRGAARDTQRESAVAQINGALEKFFLKNNSIYPSTLDKLVPVYLPSVPVDPATGKSYRYRLLGDNKNYELCVDFEQTAVQCVSSKSYDIESTDIPTDTPIPTANLSVPYIISGSIFVDLNENQVMDSGETGVGGLSVLIRDSTGASVCQTKSDVYGAFTCNMVRADTYNVLVDVPAIYRKISANPQSIVITPHSVSSSNNPIYFQFGIIPVTSKPVKTTSNTFPQNSM